MGQPFGQDFLPGGAAELPHAGAVAQVTKTQLSGILKGYRAARPDTQPGQQFLHGKGLDDIIICPRIKTGDFIAQGIQRRQQKNRHCDTSRASFPCQCDAIFSGQHSVEQDQVATVVEHLKLCHVSIAASYDRVPLVL